MSQDERDDEEARRAKAASLRERIARLKSPTEGGGGEAGDDSETQPPPGETPPEGSRAEAPKGESPRDFIHRRMREMDEDKQEE
jgi:hypothetical protein